MWYRTPTTFRTMTGPMTTIRKATMEGGESGGKWEGIAEIGIGQSLVGARQSWAELGRGRAEGGQNVDGRGQSAPECGQSARAGPLFPCFAPAMRRSHSWARSAQFAPRLAPARSTKSPILGPSTTPLHPLFPCPQPSPTIPLPLPLPVPSSTYHHLPNFSPSLCIIIVCNIL